MRIGVYQYQRDSRSIYLRDANSNLAICASFREGAASDEKVIAFYAHFHRHHRLGNRERERERWRAQRGRTMEREGSAAQHRITAARAVTFPWCAHKIPGPINNKTKSIKQFSN